MGERVNGHEWCPFSSWLSTTADGWRMCSECGQVQRWLNDEWQDVETEEEPRRTRSKPIFVDETGKPLQGRRIPKGFYVDEKRLENIREYWK